MPLNPEIIPLLPCPCGEASASAMMFEPSRWQVVCPRCHRHGKTGNTLKQASIKWNEAQKRRSGEDSNAKG
jgi:hypothetical protein